jgi:hypothetical protein
MAAQPYDPPEYEESLKQLIQEGLAYSYELLATAEEGMQELKAAVLKSIELEKHGRG